MKETTGVGIHPELPALLFDAQQAKTTWPLNYSEKWSLILESAKTLFAVLLSTVKIPRH